VFNDALAHHRYLKGHMINNDVNVLVESVLRVTTNIMNKDNWLEGSNFASASARGWRYFKIDIFAPKFASQVSTHGRANFFRKSGILKK